MEKQKLHLHLGVALKEPEIRRACSAVEAIVRAVDILDDLPPAALEEVRDHCIEYNKGRKGSFSEFKRAWIEMVVDHLADARLREHRLYYGLTGDPCIDEATTKEGDTSY
jgi:phytoene/squalene synthetase